MTETTLTETTPTETTPTEFTSTTVIGHGLLAESIDAAVDGAPGGTGAVIVAAADGWDTRAYPEVRREARERGVPWLPVRAELGRVVVGPAELPGAPGCVRCAEFRRGLARRHPAGHDAVLRAHTDVLADRPSSWLTGLAADVVAALVAEEAARLAAGEPARTRTAMLYVDLGTLGVEVHRFLPDPLCPDCGTPPADAPAPFEPVARPKPAPDVYRVRDVAAELDALVETYVDSESGLIRGIDRGSEGGLVVAAAHVGLRGGQVEGGYGRSRSYLTSRLTAVLEGIERYGGGRPGARRTAVRAAYTEVADHAVDPRTLGPHAEDVYRGPEFRFRPFDPATPYRWVWGYSFARRAPILVPEAYAYYRMHHADPASPPFAYEISNGCALGSCLEEAVLYGLLEVAERDAFLMTWYAGMSVPRIDLGSARDRTVPLIAEAMTAETGYRVMAFDTTVEQRVPCVWAMAVNPEDDGRPKVVCSAGSHLEPERAAENALSELGPILTDLIRRYPEQRDKAAAMAADSSAVTVMSDHALLYAAPEVFGRLDFLTGVTETRRFDAMSTGFGNQDLREDLRELVDRYLATGLDVVVVDQTTPEHEAGGFSCVKVVVPGTLPMTFGHANRRTDGLPRLLTVPHELGHRAGPLRPGDLNTDPHPFP
jgi:ribosomal protein S12 methylthiotransferase accessory factor